MFGVLRHILSSFINEYAYREINHLIGECPDNNQKLVLDDISLVCRNLLLMVMKPCGLLLSKEVSEPTLRLLLI